jgi:hypothetical protein
MCEMMDRRSGSTLWLCGAYTTMEDFLPGSFCLKLERGLRGGGSCVEFSAWSLLGEV